MRRTVLTAAGLLVGTALAIPTSAAAHGVAQRADLPIPEEFFSWGAAIVLIVSFLLLGFFWPKPKLEDDSWRPIRFGPAQALVSKPVRVLAATVGGLLFLLVLWAGFAGVQTPAANLTPTFVYVIFWVGLVLLSVLFGDVFRALNPWAAAARPVAWVATKAAGTPMPAPLEYPERLGRWPAAVGLLAFVSMELVYDDPDLPRNVAVATVIYSICTWIGMALYGIDRWLDRGEAFSVYYNLFARISPLATRDGVLGVQRPLAGLARLDPAPGTVALVAVIIGSTSFDGFKEGPTWVGWSADVNDFFASLGFSPQWALQLSSLVGLIGLILVVVLFYRLGVAGARSVGGGFTTNELANKFVHSLVPIGLAYVAAHYMSLLLFQGQAAGYLASDPLGRGWDLFGTVEDGIDYSVLGAEGVWYWQVGFVVVGHIAALTLAHDRALVLYDNVKLAVRSQYWLLGVMVGFTTFALWLLSQANA